MSLHTITYETQPLIVFDPIACLSIVVASLITVGDVGVDHPATRQDIQMVRRVSFTDAFLAACNIAIAFCKS